MTGSPDALTEALFKLYSDAGTEVTYTAESGKEVAYWPKRFLQTLRRAVERDDVVGFVEGMIEREPSRGFGYLADAGRLDLTVESVVAERFADRFPLEIVKAARERLLEQGYEPGSRQASESQSTPVRLDPGTALLVQLTVGPKGKIEAHLVATKPG